MNQDKLGCYWVGDLKFYSKLEAIEMHKRTGIHPRWDFNDAVFSSYDWTQEPSESILELYRQRAQQLRDQYDYIILSYSGGADSQAVLDAFLDNDIKVDELVTYTNYQATGDRNNFLNSEAFKVSYPNVERYKEKFPWLKHRILDLSTMIMDYFDHDGNRFDWIYKQNMYVNPNNSSRESMPLKVKEWADIIHSGKKLCVLWGHDKPRVFKANGKFVFRFLDLLDNAATVKSMSGQEPYNNELFFWTPDSPKIVIKQAHLVKNYLSKADVLTLPFTTTTQVDMTADVVNGVQYCSTEVDGKTVWLSNHGIHTLIYPRWNINTWSAGKNTSLLLSVRDKWFYALNDGIRAKQNWKNGLDKLWSILPDYWKNDPDNLARGIKGCWSPEYFLE